MLETTTIIWTLFYLHAGWYLLDGIMCSFFPVYWMTENIGPRSGQTMKTSPVSELFIRACGGALLSFDITLLLTIHPVEQPILSLLQILPNVFVGGFAMYAWATNRFQHDLEMSKVPKAMSFFHIFLISCIITRVVLAINHME